MDTSYELKKGVQPPKWLLDEDGRDESKGMDAFYLYNWQIEMIEELAEEKYGLNEKGKPPKSRWLREELKKLLTGRYD